MLKVNKKILIFFCILGIITSYFIINLYLNKKNKLILENKDSKLISIKLQDKNGDYIDSEIDSWPKEGYIFNKELSTCENGGEVNFENGQIVLNTNGSEKCTIYFDIDNIGNRCKGKEFASCIKENYEIDGAIIYHNLADATKKEFPNYNLVANDDSYRYAGSNDIVNNYVCLDNSTVSGECESIDNLYRIIGIFKNEDEKSTDYGKYELKLIKYDYTTADETGGEGVGAYFGNFLYADWYYNETNAQEKIIYKWNTLNTNKWEDSDLNKINLNGKFYNYLANKNPKLVEKIIETKWHINGCSQENCLNSNAKIAYTSEMINDSTTSANIGLMYLSDFYYAAQNSYWNLKGRNSEKDTSPYEDYRDADSKNWLVLGLNDWFITSNSDTDNKAYMAYYRSNIDTIWVNSWEGYYCVRPVFYLTSSIKLLNGFGTKDNPYRIS